MSDIRRVSAQARSRRDRRVGALTIFSETAVENDDNSARVGEWRRR